MTVFGKVTIVSALTLVLIASNVAGCTYSSSGNSQKELTNIVASIVANPYSYEGQQVTVVGYYRGWDLLHETETGPPVTRSDWVIKDTSGAIYVSALSKAKISSLDPSSREDVNTILKVVGIVHVSTKGQPYIEAENVEVK
jgi:hypothetical protein